MGIERLGICVIPPAVVRDELASGTLRILPAEPTLSDLTFTATYANRLDSHFVADAARIAQAVARTWAARADKAGLSAAIRNDDWRLKRHDGNLSLKTANRFGIEATLRRTRAVLRCVCTNPGDIR